MKRLERRFYQRDAREVARDLLGGIIVTRSEDGTMTSGAIVEVEAYLGENDEASHSFRGRSDRNAAMFLEGGHAYVYLSYGIHYCFNIVTGREGSGDAVLIRGIVPHTGLETMQQRRGSNVAEKNLANGPGKVAQALAIGAADNAVDLVISNRIWIEAGEDVDDNDVTATPRIGISRSLDHHWRWLLVPRHR